MVPLPTLVHLCVLVYLTLGTAGAVSCAVMDCYSTWLGGGDSNTPSPINLSSAMDKMSYPRTHVQRDSMVSLIWNTHGIWHLWFYITALQVDFSLLQGR